MLLPSRLLPLVVVVAAGGLVATAAAADDHREAAPPRSLRGRPFGPVIRPAPFWPADAKQQQQAQEQWALLGSDGGDSSEGEGLLAAVYDQLDALRTTEGLAPLTRHTALVQSANATASLLAAAGVLQHDVGGVTALQRARAAGYEGSEVKESYQRLSCKDAATCTTDVARIISEDDEFHAAVADPEAKYVGVAAAPGAGPNEVFVVQHIGK